MLNISGFFKKGENSNFDKCYESYRKEIYRHINFLIGSSQAAEDIAQETFIRFLNSPPEHSNTLAWLKKVATNLTYNYLRDHNTHRNREHEVFEDESGNVVSIEDVAIRNMEVRKIKRILDGMPARYRICLMLKFSGYKYSEIAELAGIELSSVGTILARAQAKFKERYLKEAEL